MRQARPSHVNHPPTKVAKTRVDPQNAHACPFFHSLFIQLARNKNICHLKWRGNNHAALAKSDSLPSETDGIGPIAAKPLLNMAKF
jgi:hypothetical protein